LVSGQRILVTIDLKNPHQEISVERGMNPPGSLHDPPHFITSMRHIFSAGDQVISRDPNAFSYWCTLAGIHRNQASEKGTKKDNYLE
jgi:hypothetical protein